MLTVFSGSLGYPITILASVLTILESMSHTDGRPLLLKCKSNNIIQCLMFSMAPIAFRIELILKEHSFHCFSYCGFPESIWKFLKLQCFQMMRVFKFSLGLRGRFCLSSHKSSVRIMNSRNSSNMQHQSSHESFTLSPRSVLAL